MKLFTQMASAMEAPTTRDKVIDDVYVRMKINSLPEKTITEIAAGMITEEEIMTRLSTARSEGRKEGLEEGEREERNAMILNILKKGKTPSSIADFLDIPLSEVLAVQKRVLQKKRP